MPTPTPSTHTAPATSAHPAPRNGPRAVAAEFFTLARSARSQTAPPPFRNGDSVSCPQGTDWMRYDGSWIIPGQPHGLALPDQTVTGWWQARHNPGSKVALVHRLTTPEETDLITGDHYTSATLTSNATGDAFCEDPVSGAWLRSIARQVVHTRTVSVHLELPSGIVTLHSPRGGDVFFHPATPTTPRPTANDTPFRPAPGAATPAQGSQATNIHPPLPQVAAPSSAD